VRLFSFYVSLVLCLSGRVHAQDAGPTAQDSGISERTDAGQMDDANVTGEECGSDTGNTPDLPTVAEAIVNSPVTSDVVVTASRPLSKDRTQDATLIQGERIRDSSRNTVFDVLSQESADVYVPGHGVAMHGVANGATGGIKIRGLGGSPNSQVVVVEDGVPDYQGIFGHPIPDAYAAHLIDDVLVIKGGDSTLYGSNAMAGVVAIRSLWLDQEGYEARNDARYGSYATLQESVSVLGRVGSWDVAAAFTDTKTDGHRQGAGGSNMVDSTAVRYRLGPNLRLTVRNKVAHIQGGDAGPVTNPFLDHWFDVWRENASLQLAYNANGLRASLTPYLNVGIHRLYDGFYSRDYIGGAIGEMELRLHRMASLLLGLSAEAIDGLVENRITGERPSVLGLGDVSFYNQVTLRPVVPISIVLGSRGLYSSKYGFVALYKAGVRWEAGHGFFLHGHISRNFRQPTLRELYLPYPTANPDLKAEYAVNADLGVGCRSDHFEIACTGYRTEAQNLIKYFGSWPAAEVVNIDHIVIPGVEGRVGVKRLGPVSASISANWQDVGRYSRQNPDAKLNFTLEAAQEFGPHFLAGSLTGEWVHGLYMADYDRQPIPNVFVMDLAVRYRYTSPARGTLLEPYLLLRNFLDRQYAYVAGYTMPGFNVLVGLKVGF
jgi:outer membrane cobalamin receptor